MKRYVVLREPDGEHLPMGLAVERDRDVVILALDEFALPKRIREPYRVVQRDLSVVEYVPGQEGYFEQVLVELARVASIGSHGTVEDTGQDALIELFTNEVQKPRLRAPRPYVVSDAPWEPTTRPWRPATVASGDCHGEPPRVAA